MLTPRMRDTHRFIVQYMREHGCAPSFREIGESLGLNSTGAVSRLVKSLVKRGFLEYATGARRGLHPLRDENMNPVHDGTETHILNLVSAYDDGWTAAKLGHTAAACRAEGQLRVAWRLGYAAAKAGKSEQAAVNAGGAGRILHRLAANAQIGPQPKPMETHGESDQSST